MDIYDHVRKSRLYSYIMTGMTCYWLSATIWWIHSLDLNTLTPQAVALITALLTALVALVKFTYTFAIPKTDISN